MGVWGAEGCMMRAQGPPGSHLPMYKTKLCQRFMAGGDCPRGESCSFAHGPHELRALPGGPPPMQHLGGPMPPPPGPMMPVSRPRSHSPTRSPADALHCIYLPGLAAVPCMALGICTHGANG